MRLLDLYAGAGGAACGYARAGFEVVGVDLHPQPNYPYEFCEMDALDALTVLIAGHRIPGVQQSYLDSFDAIHASPPCQAHTAMKTMWNAREHADLVEATRILLIATGLPYVIENVPGAPLIDPVTICGTSLGLTTGAYELRRHRLFEANWPLMVPPCAHGQRGRTIGIYGDHARDRRRVPGENPERGTQMTAPDALAAAREAMEMPWADWSEIRQAVPPAFTELIGHQLAQYLRTAA